MVARQRHALFAGADARDILAIVYTWSFGCL
jgi:hypothetical protein